MPAIRTGLRPRLAIVALAAWVCLPVNGAWAQAKPPADDRIADYTGSASIALTVYPDGTSQEVETRRIRILAESAVRREGKQSFSFTASLDRLEVLEAVTEKPDGRRIPVPARAIDVQDARWGDGTDDSIDTHDYKQQVIIFSDVSVGDSVFAVVQKKSRAFSRSIYPQHQHR
jgi:hypothetical protein